MKKKPKIESFSVRYKKLKGKKVILCEYDGICNNKAHKEVYFFMLGGKYEDKGWNYLCKKHFTQEQKKFKGKLPYGSVE